MTRKIVQPPPRGPTPHELATAAGLRLSAAQSAILKAFWGDEPLTREERRAFDAMTRSSGVPTRPGGWAELWVEAGRRGGKTTHIAAPIALALALTPSPLLDALLAPGERARILCLAPTIPLTRQLFDAVEGLAAKLRIPVARREGEIEFTGLRTTILVSTADHVAVRSGTLLGLIVDEAALLPSDEGADGWDVELFASAFPGLASMGALARFAGIFSPWRRAGVAHVTVAANIGKLGGRVLALNAPTWILQPGLTEARTKELEKDPLRHAREYGAQTPAQDVRAAYNAGDVHDRIEAGVVERPYDPTNYYAGCGDLAFTNDGAVLAIGHLEKLKDDGGPPKNVLVLDCLRIRRAKPGERLDAGALVAEWASTLRRYKVTTLWLDGFGFDLASAMFRERGIECQLLPMNLPQQAARFDALGGRLRAGTIKLLDNPDMKRELCELQFELRAGGVVVYQAPRRKNAHDDCCDALAGLCVEATRGLPSGGNIACRIGISRDESSISMTASWVEVKKDALGFETFLPAAPPRGTPAWFEARENAKASGMWCAEYDDDETTAARSGLNAPIKND